MGITYKVRIRCLRVDDKSKVNLNPIHYDDNKDREIWQEQLKKYYDELYPNVSKIVGMYNHDTCYKSYYLMANLLIPRWYDWKTCPQVMVISNFAYDRRGDTLYKTTFFDTLGDVISVEKRIIPCEENRFMLLIPEEAHSFNYLITSPFENVDNSSHECVHFFNHEKKCITCPKYVCHTEDDSDSDGGADGGGLLHGGGRTLRRWGAGGGDDRAEHGDVVGDARGDRGGILRPTDPG